MGVPLMSALWVRFYMFNPAVRRSMIFWIVLVDLNCLRLFIPRML